MIKDKSPDGIVQATRLAGAKFNFVLVDGIHIYSQVKRDVDGLLDHLADEAVVLFHDAFHAGVATAISESIAADLRLHDCGYPCARPAVSMGLLAYGGFRMVRFAATPMIDARKIVTSFYTEIGKTPPKDDPALFDHDPWYCRTYQKCPYCLAREASEKELSKS